MLSLPTLFATGRPRFPHMALAVLAAATLAAAPARAAGAPSFAAIFNDHAVLQRDQPIAVWGQAAPHAGVTVQLAGARAQVKADAKGSWRARLPALPAGGPHVLSASANGAAKTIGDIMIGDVFLCSGQSNMELAVAHATNAPGDIAYSANPQLRFANIARDSAGVPRSEFASVPQWQVAGPHSTGQASAVCFYMARAIQRRLQVPVGFINASWGGTTIQSWISGPGLRQLADYRDSLDVVALWARNPAEGLRVEERRLEAWWDRIDPQAGAQRGWAQPGFDDGAWRVMAPGARWNDLADDALRQHRGVVWLRTTVELSPQQAEAASQLLLGQIAAADTTWVNGVRVGASNTWWQGREYTLPRGLLKAGRNVIALRVLGDDSGGGLVSRAAERVLRTADGAPIALPDRWKYQLGSHLQAWQPAPPWEPPASLSTLYNGMIAPLQGLRFKGVAWYQGEANAGNAAEYRTLLPMLFADWRATFGQAELPFLVAQLSAFGSVAITPSRSSWAELRLAQSQAVHADPHAGLAVTLDVGDRTDIHPSQKTVVGERLARAARSVAYGEHITPGGPQAHSVLRAGNDLLVRFANTNGGLRTYSSDSAIGFEVCEANNACRYAHAIASGDTVRLKDAATPGATKVRYAWADAPFINLFSADDLPADGFELEVR